MIWHVEAVDGAACRNRDTFDTEQGAKNWAEECSREDERLRRRGKKTLYGDCRYVVSTCDRGEDECPACWSHENAKRYRLESKKG